MKETLMNFASRLDTMFRRFCSLAVGASALALALPAASCSDDASGGGGTGGANALGGASALGGAGGAPDAFPGCFKGKLEGDFVEDTALVGPGVDQETGALAPGNYFIATTYLAMEPGVVDHVFDLSAPVISTMMSTDGFVAMSTAQSESCLSLRTLTVWQSEDSMFELVASPAHSAAMAEMSELSRGSSNTISWEGMAADASWEIAIEKLGADVGADL
jgi:quinol monooxygenase YgiN